MKKTFYNLITVVWLGVVLFVVYKLTKDLNHEEFIWNTPDYLYLTLGLLGGVLFALPMIWLLYDYFPEVRTHRAPLARSTVVTLMPLMGKYIPGKIWATAGFMAYAKNILNIRPVDAGLFQVHNQVVSLSATTLLSIIGLFILQQRMEAELFERIFISISVVALFLLLSVYTLRYNARKNWSKYAPNKILLHTLLYCVQKLSRALALAWFVCAFLPVGELSAEIMFAFIIAMQLGALAFFAPAGIGVTEGAYVVLLYGAMPMEQALQVALIARIWQTITDLALSFFAYLKWRSLAV